MASMAEIIDLEVEDSYNNNIYVPTPLRNSSELLRCATPKPVEFNFARASKAMKLAEPVSPGGPNITEKSESEVAYLQVAEGDGDAFNLNPGPPSSSPGPMSSPEPKKETSKSAHHAEAARSVSAEPRHSQDIIHKDGGDGLNTLASGAVMSPKDDVKSLMAPVEEGLEAEQGPEEEQPKKRARYLITPGMSEAEQEEVKRLRRQRHRDVSAAWHQKFSRKGEIRDQGVADGGLDSRASPHAPVEVPDLSVPLTDMRAAKRRFVSDWISQSDMPPSRDRCKAALQAWMQSTDRAALLAGRQSANVVMP